MFYNNKKVLVTGGTGFVGTHFVKELLHQGAHVRISVHRRQPIIHNSGIEMIHADLTDLQACRSAASGMQYVFHCAGVVSGAAVTAENQMLAITTNLILTAQMLYGAWLQDVERFLVFSSSTGYPEADHPIKEEEMWNGPTYPNYFGYGWMRRYFELLGEFVASRSRMGVAICRPTAVYGRHDDFNLKTSHVIPALIRRAVAKEDPFVVWGTGQEVRDFLHVTDLVHGCLLLLAKHAASDPVNIGYGQGFTVKDVVSIILAAAGHDRAKIEFDSTKPTTIPFRMVDTSKARELLGFKPNMTLEDGLGDTVNWYQNNYA